MVNLKTISRYVRGTAAALLLSATVPLITLAQQFNVRVFDLDNKPIPGAQVNVSGKFGSMETKSDTSGVATFNGVSDSLEVRVAKDGYIGGKKNILRGTDFYAALIPKKQFRYGRSGTGTDSIDARADELKSIFNVDNFIRRNPRLLKTMDTVYVDTDGLSSADSSNTWSRLNWYNDFAGKTIFRRKKLTEYVDAGVIVTKAPSGNSTIPLAYEPDLSYLIQSRARISSFDITTVLHEITYHGLIDASNHGVSYTPTNYGEFANNVTSTKDVIYMRLGYALQKSRKSFLDTADVRGNRLTFDMSSYSDNITTGIKIDRDNNSTPQGFALYQNYPNPFNPNTRIDYSLNVQGMIDLSVHDALGRKVRTLVNEEVSRGEHSVDFDAQGLASGIYFYKLTSPGKEFIKKMILTK